MSLTILTYPPSSPLTSPIYTLTLTSSPDHRLTPELISSFLSHLDDIERDWLKRRVIAKKAAKDAGMKGYLGLGGAVVIRGEGEKFFSNGEFEGEDERREGGRVLSLLEELRLRGRYQLVATRG